MMLPSPSSVLSAYASMSTSIMLFQTMVNQIFPVQLQNHIINAVRFYWKPKNKMLTLVVDEKDGLVTNQIFSAVELYMSSRISPDSDRLRITKSAKERQINIKFADIGVISDSFEGIPVTWTYVRQDPKQNSSASRFEEARKYIELTFDKKHREAIVTRYVPSVIKWSQQVEMEKKVVKLYNLESGGYAGPNGSDSLKLDHPSTFATLAMDPALKREIMHDLDMFLSRREFYKRIGKVWKRGYLLYGPPGTGKSSLIAAIANYTKFNVYDLQLMNVYGDSSLRNLLLKTKNRSILVIEDIDCGVKLPDRSFANSNSSRDPGFTLSGLLNFIDGLWSSCGDERIIIFTTNHKERLDPALLRPGRMDKHIHMSYLTFEGFKILAANYLDIHDASHSRFNEINDLIEHTKVTPAEVADELLISDDVEVVLQGLVRFLKRKKVDGDEIDDNDDEAKKAKVM